MKTITNKEMTSYKETTAMPAVSEGQSTLDPDNPVCITTIDAEEEIVAPAVDWIDVVVDESGDVKVNGQDFWVNDVYAGSENPLGLTLTMRRTKGAGRRFEVYDSLKMDPAPETYVYAMVCNIPGLYYLGKEYGYRKKSADEEACPLRRVFRTWGLSVDLIHYDISTQFVRCTTTERLPVGNRYLYQDTNAQKEKLIDERFGRKTIALTDFTYVICIEKNAEQVTEDKVTTFKWISGVYLSSDVSESDLLMVADKVNTIMCENREEKKHGGRNNN